MNPAQSSAYERLKAVTARLQVPDAVREVATAPPRDPEPDQIWRAAWQHTVQLVVIAAVDDNAVQVIPASMEHYSDADTLLLPAEASTLKQPLVLWWALKQPLPWCVLDRQVSQLTVPLRDSPHLDRAVEMPPPGTQWGKAVPSPAAAEYRGAVTDNLARLSAARWEPKGTGALAQLLRQEGISARQLATRLQLSAPQALAIWRGQAPVTSDQAHSLAGLLNLPTHDVLAANPALPPAVVHELDRPLRRPQVRSLAARHGDTEEQARVRAAFGILTLAARQDDRTNPDWAARAERYFELSLG